MFVYLIATASAYQSFLEVSQGNSQQNSEGGYWELGFEMVLDRMNIKPEYEDYQELLDNPEFDESIPVIQTVGTSDSMSGHLLISSYEAIDLTLIEPNDKAKSLDYYEIGGYSDEDEYTEALIDSDNPISISLLHENS